MGKHFDSLVELVKRDISQTEHSRNLIDVNKHLRDLVNTSVLFEFPLKKIDILPDSGKTEWEYHRYLQDWIRLSQEHGSFMAMPFQRMAIEDPESVVSMLSLGGSRYRVTNYTTRPEQNRDLLQIAEVEVMDGAPEKPSLKYLVVPFYASFVYPKGISEIRVINPLNMDVAFDITNAATAFVQENFYIMDPENFIIRKESNASRQLQSKLDRKNGKEIKPRKTIMRPHYIVCSEEDTCTFLKSEAKDREPIMIHPVRGHWKTLVSERYKAAKGRRIQIEQYYRGKGVIEGKNGWHYQVLVKEDLEVKPVE